jgi:hypothetical protein
MKLEEGKFKKKIKEEIEKYDAFVQVTHGNIYQAGFPDMHITAKTGLLSWVELKFWGGVNLPKEFQSLHSQMHGAQINVIKHQMWKRNAACLLVSQIGMDLDNCAVCYKDKFNIMPWKHLAKLLAISSDFNTVLTHAIPH